MAYQKLTSDNGPPYPSHEMERYAIEKGFALTPVSPEDPKGNGFAENFVKFLCKMVHTSVIDGKDPKLEIFNYLLQYRATPHTTTGLSPAEMLFGGKIHTKLPRISVPRESEVDKEVRKKHDQKKLKQKDQHDKRHQAKEKLVEIGDQVLIQRKKSTVNSLFDLDPFTVTGVDGNKVSMERKDGTSRIRDKNQIKVVPKRPKDLIPTWERRVQQPVYDYASLEIEGNMIESEEALYPAPTEGMEQQAEPPQEHSAEPTEEEILPREEEIQPGAMFDIDEEEEERMNALLLSAMTRDNSNSEVAQGRTTRSSGLQLEWNPVMNSNETVIHK